jgi:hypothetical protein
MYLIRLKKEKKEIQLLFHKSKNPLLVGVYLLVAITPCVPDFFKL